MIDRQGVEQILAQYAKHGWGLRRVLLSERLRNSSPDIAGAFDGVEIKLSDLDGLWFSRSSRPGITAWELRHLSRTPYALVENIPDDADQAETELALKRTETKMIEAIGKRPTGH
jgi:hypothetical protein